MFKQLFDGRISTEKFSPSHTNSSWRRQLKRWTVVETLNAQWRGFHVVIPSRNVWGLVCVLVRVRFNLSPYLIWAAVGGEVSRVSEKIKHQNTSNQRLINRWGSTSGVWGARNSSRSVGTSALSQSLLDKAAGNLSFLSPSLRPFTSSSKLDLWGHTLRPDAAQSLWSFLRLHGGREVTHQV